MDPRLRTLHDHIDFTANCWTTTCSLENVNIDKASARFVVIKYFRCLLSCHGLLLSFPSLSPCFSFRSHPPSHPTLLPHPPIHMQIIGQIFEMKGGTRPLGPASPIPPVPWLLLPPSPPGFCLRMISMAHYLRGPVFTVVAFLVCFLALSSNSPRVMVEAGGETAQSPQPLFSCFSETSLKNVSFW